MPKILAFMTVGALAGLIVINNLYLHKRAQEAFVPIPTAHAASLSFPEAPAATSSAPAPDPVRPSFPQAASVTSASAAPAPIKTAAAKIEKAPAAAPVKAAAKNPAAPAPVRLSIPSIALNDKVVPVGVNSLGEMAVPSGSTSNIGWYAKGTVPGNLGSAVMDAHVFAALARLDEVAAGDDIYVGMADGATKHFVVTRTQVYKVGDLSPQELFSSTGGRYLHLITCAGTLTPDHTSYTHRLVVYATLADD